MDSRDLSPELRHRIRVKLAEVLGIDLDRIPEDFDDDFLEQMGADSLNLVEIIMEIDEEFGDDDVS